MAGRFEIMIRVAGIVVGISKGVAMIQEDLDRLDRDGKAEALAKRNLHARDADAFPAHIVERTAAVARVDLGSRLQITRPLQGSRLGAQDAFSDCAFQPQRAADGANSLANSER